MMIEKVCGHAVCRLCNAEWFALILADRSERMECPCCHKMSGAVLKVYAKVRADGKLWPEDLL